MTKKIQESELTLKTLREAAGFTQEQLAKELNRGIRTISNWENGNKIPKFDNAIELASKLKVSLKTLALSMRFDVSGIPDDTSIQPKNKGSDNKRTF